MVRWGGEDRIGTGEQVESDGDWGQFGSPPCDFYMAELVRLGILKHPILTPDSTSGMDVEGQSPFNFELLSLFVRDSRDTACIGQMTAAIAEQMNGVKKASFWMLWPAEWIDFGGKDYAGYITTDSLFNTMRACEAAGIRSSFPHPADQYECITSKVWMADLAGMPGALLPAAV